MQHNLNNLLDNHYHFRGDKQIVKNDLTHAFSNGFYALIEAGTNLDDYTERLELIEAFEKVFFTTGIHPDNAANFTFDNDSVANFKMQANHPKNLAVGEIGLDYSYDVPKNIQQNLFAKQLELAKELKLPVMLHVRDAFDDTLAMLKEQNISNGVVHCFTGSKDIAKAFLDIDFYLSYSGILTFKSATDIADSAIFAPLNKIFVETDAPFLAPVPYRGKENKLEYIYFIYNFLANLKSITVQDLSNQTKLNFNKFYFKKDLS